jgi:hypothetical protein
MYSMKNILILVMMLVLLLLQFYFQNGRPPPKELKEQCLYRTDNFFNSHMDGLQIHGEISISLRILSFMF